MVALLAGGGQRMSPAVTPAGSVQRAEVGMPASPPLRQ